MLAPGTMLRNDAYRVERQLASGGFGNTYLVRNVVFDELFAMKEFFMRGVNLRKGNMVTVSVPENHTTFEGQREKFKKEAVRLRNLRNPHIVKVHDLFEENGTVYYVMDYINGESVAELLKRTDKPMDEQQSLQILRQLLDALGEVHSHQIWHLDIKPGNIMLDGSGNAYLIDFGASKQFNSHGSQTSSAMAYTPGYAPVEQVEQAMDKFGPWTDFYALGATLYYMQTLKQPPTMTALSEGNAFSFPPAMSAMMRQLIAWMMNPQRKMRPESVEQVRDFLQEDSAQTVPSSMPSVDTVAQPLGGSTAANEPVSQPSPVSGPISEPVSKPSTAKKRLFAFIGMLVVLLIGLGLWVWLSGSHGNSEPADDLSEAVDDVTTIDLDGKYLLKGAVGSYGAEMSITIKGKTVTGLYHYDFQAAGVNLSLNGKVKKDGSLAINEYAPDGVNSGRFEGTFDGREFSGTFYNVINGKKFYFRFLPTDAPSSL